MSSSSKDICCYSHKSLGVVERSEFGEAEHTRAREEARLGPGAGPPICHSTESAHLPHDSQKTPSSRLTTVSTLAVPTRSLFVTFVTFNPPARLSLYISCIISRHGYLEAIHYPSYRLCVALCYIGHSVSRSSLVFHACTT